MNFKHGVLAFCLLVTPSLAHAQSATGTGQAAAGANAGSAAQSGSAAIIQQTFGAAPAQQGVTYGGGTNSTNRQIIEGGTQDRYRATIRNTPDGSVAGFGIGLGGNWSDPDCERRQLAALSHNTGQQAVAQEILCGSRDYREARQRIGQPCAADVQRVAATQPVLIANPQPGPVQVPAPAPVVRSGPPDWCQTASAAERRQYRTVCGG
jgi:hypothetical protein